MAQYSSRPPDMQFYPPPATPPQMPPPPIAPDLEPLLNAHQFVIKQKKDMVEIFTGWERNNRYEIYNENGQMAYFAVEVTSEMSLCCFGEHRPFCIRIFDTHRTQAIKLQADVDCCTQHVAVEIPEGILVATIEKKFAFMTPSFYVKNAVGGMLFKIKSHISAAIGSFGSVKFDILSGVQQMVVGQISKEWGCVFANCLLMLTRSVSLYQLTRT